MFCEKCGTQIPEGSNVCPNCSAQSQQAQQQPQPDYQYQNYQQMYNFAPKKEQSKTEKLFASVFKTKSWVTIVALVLGAIPVVFSLISIITSLFAGIGFSYFISNFFNAIKQASFYGLIALFVIVMIAKIDYKDE